MRLIDADELITAFPCGESVRTESVRATINHLPTIEGSEDAISREGLSDKVGRYYAERGDFGSFECSWILNAIKNAPSVVPKARPIELHLDVTDDVVDRAVEQIRAEGEDCISREYLLSKVYDMDNDNLVVDLKDIENAPSVVPSRAEGEWAINEPEEIGFGTIYECPYCKYEVEFEPTNYCPNCGAKMRLE